MLPDLVIELAAREALAYEAAEAVLNAIRPRVVFVSNGRAKQGHDAVAQHLVHSALETMYSVHHVLRGRVEQPLGNFWIEAADEFSRVLDVREEYRPLLALASERIPDLERTLREPPLTLQQVQYLSQDLVKCHGRPASHAAWVYGTTRRSSPYPCDRRMIDGRDVFVHDGS
jgi:hypothetical protein